MAKKDRKGERKTREQRKNMRVPELGYYIVVTDTEGTERCYFGGLHKELPESIQEKLVIKVVETKTADLIEKCIEFASYDPQYRIPWIVFDRDQVKNFDQIITEAERKGINVGWSNPCFEIWMHAYYGTMPNIPESWKCCSNFADIYKSKTGVEYDKADESLYKKIIQTGNEEKALKLAEQKHTQCIENGYKIPSQMCPCTTVYKLVGEINEKSIKWRNK